MSDTSGETANIERSGARSYLSAAKFSDWASQVRLNTEIRSGDFPEPLQRLIEGSNVVPDWIYNRESPKFGYCRLAHQQLISSLILGVQRSTLVPSEDPKLSDDTELMLPQVLNVVTHHRTLATPGMLPTEADLRHAMDALGFYVWDLVTKNDLRHRLGHSLQLPKSSSTQMYETKPDSIVFFRLNDPPAPTISHQIDLACSSLARARQDKSSILHWATEFKRDSNETPAERQLFCALVSGLYQRRAYGFPDHFVFGTAHHSTTTLEVFAATWEVPVGGQEPKAGTSGPRIPDSDVADAGQRGPEGAAEGILDTHSEGKGKGPQTQAPDGTEKDGQIVIYHLGTFNVDVAVEVLRLYLLMRSTQSLASQYKTAITESSEGRITQQLQDLAWIYDWPAPKCTQPPPSTTSGSRKKRRLSTVPETKEGAHESVGIVGVDTTIKLRYVEEMNSESKVLKYLAESPWDQCEPVPDWMIDSNSLLL